MKLRRETQDSRIIAGIVVSLSLVATLIAMSIQALVGFAAPNEPTKRLSPFIFGTNLGLFNNNDQVLQSEETRMRLKEIGVTIMRTPMRTELPDETELAAVQMIKDLGLTPLIILHNSAKVPDALENDRRIVEGVRKIFGDSPVYYEYGNEPDYLGISKEEYTAAWNDVIPALKEAAGPSAQFIGPVLMEWKGKEHYFQYFIEHAVPRPDMVSWHEYTCSKKEDGEACIRDIPNWTNHFKDARARMQQALGTELPIMITEWNYAPDLSDGEEDGKNSDPDFIHAWTSQALQTLALNHPFAAMQYSATNTAIPLIDKEGEVAAQGKTFQQSFRQMQARFSLPEEMPMRKIV